MKNNIKVFGIASGIAAEVYGASLGVWDIYYNFHTIMGEQNINVYYTNTNATKLNVIKPLSDLYKQINTNFIEQHQHTNKYLFITGDHSNAIAVWSAVSNAYNEDIGIIWVDAHLDSHTPETSESKNVHGMPVSHLMGYGDSLFTNLIQKKIKPENICFIATRDYEQEELDFVTKHNIKVFFMKDINASNMNNVFAEAIEHVSKHTKYFGISIDTDSMDPTVAPATGCYNPGGLSVENICDNLKNIINNPNFIALEITEYNPILDVNRKTFNAIKNIIKSAYNFK